MMFFLTRWCRNAADEIPKADRVFGVFSSVLLCPDGYRIEIHRVDDPQGRAGTG